VPLPSGAISLKNIKSDFNGNADQVMASILTAEKIRFKKNNFFAIGPVVSAPRTQTYVTELK
jgi:hypothetical protein